MALVLHIVIALTSIIYTGYTYFDPSKSKLNLSYVLVAMTIATGTFLMIVLPARMVQTCAEGLVYLAFVGLGIVSARHKLIEHPSEN